MVTTNALPDIGVAVPMPDDLNLEAVKNLSPGQLAYLDLVVSTEMSQRMANPATTFAQYTRVSGADWSGHAPQIEDPRVSAQHCQIMRVMILRTRMEHQSFPRAPCQLLQNVAMTLYR